MTTHRRFIIAGLGASLLAACATTPRSTMTTVRPAAASATPPDLLPQRDAGYDAWIAGFRGRATAQGVSPATFDAAFRNAGFLPGVVTRDRNQTEFRRTLEDYLAIAASDDRIAKGRAAYARHAPVLNAIEARYGVSRYIVTAIWGLESFYGERQGDIPVIAATSTLAYEGRRGAFFEAQTLEALRILQAGDITPARMTGSWAGAMGHTQFIPTTFAQFAVDFTGDGRRDIWADDPSDALASAANYLARSGWQTGTAWGREDPNGALEPQPGGPRFSTTANFRAIKRYNNSDAYAIGVGHLADRIAGGGPLRMPFPPDRFGLTKPDRIALQNGLTRRGFDTQGADGVIGANTTRAIEAFQRAQGLPVTAEPSQALLRMLR
ncbi:MULTISPECIES: lytic murein transglycosylase [unclassified Yoonia]|uniref:lytic murein transglycosylase n=1 Tax=unclassified Yoonia TaxID=2629118 RepID=UPI002AFF1BEA|nr:MULTISPECIES: lytic murein transglycosylase [unclassified Yoonia]